MFAESSPVFVEGVAGAEAWLQRLGVVVLIDGASVIRHVSASCEELFGELPAALLGRQLAVLVGEADADALRGGAGRVEWRHVSLRRSGVVVKVRAFDPGQGLTGLDFLPLPVDAAVSDVDAIERVARWSERVAGSDSTAELMVVAAAVARECAGFSDSWVIHLHLDGSGEVVASDATGEDGKAPAVWVRPADLPPLVPQFRRRYVPLFVMDVAAKGTTLVPPAPRELQLTGSALQLPFVAWLEQFSRGAAGAVALVPIVVDGTLWGYVLSRHWQPRRVLSGAQAELRLLGTAVGVRLAELRALELAQERAVLSRAAAHAMQGAVITEDLVEGLTRDSWLAAVCSAGSVIVSIGGDVAVGGTELADAVQDQVLAVAHEGLRRRQAEPVVSSTTLDGVQPLESAAAAGYLAIRLGIDAQDVVVWVRGEHLQFEQWGAPWLDSGSLGSASPVDPQPQTVLGSCRPWTVAERRQGTELREVLGEMLVRRLGEVHRLNRELKRSNEEYDAFAGAAAHDLKAPLRGIVQNAEFFLEDAGATLDQAGEQQISTVVRLATRMTGMLDDMMAFAQAGKGAWSPRLLELRSAVDDAVELIGKPAQASQITTSDRQIYADPSTLRQLLLNLISNAIKYSSGPAQITVDVTDLKTARRTSAIPSSLASAGDGTPVLAIADRGIGIGEAHHERVFKLFRQLDAGVEGTGAGLAICRLLCQRHSGDIWLQSAPGQGTTVYAVIEPSASAAPRAPAQA